MGVIGNHSKISCGGKLVRELLATEDYCLVNNMTNAKGGPFTRVDPADPNIKSCLDLLICSIGLRPFIESLIIDSNREHTMKRAVFKNGKFCITYSDHFTLILKMKNLPRNHTRKEKQIRWNLKKQGGWELYKELAEEKSDKMIEVIDDTSKSIEEVVKKFERMHNDIKFEAFGKVTLKDKNNVQEKQQKNKTSEEEEARNLLKKQTEKAEEELIKLKDSKKGRTASIFKIVQAIQGPRKGGSMQAYSITDPKSGEVAVSGNEIKRISLEYCREVLTKNEAEGSYKKEIALKGSMHMERMHDSQESMFKPSRESFKRVLKKFKDNDKRNYDFLVKTGEKFKEGVFRLCRRMIEEEEFPCNFDNTTLHQIFKGKGKREVLSNNRLIHSKEWLPRTVEGMVVDYMKDNILKGASPYQIGGQPGHQPQEHIFSIKSMISKYTMEGKLMMLQTYDISKFFD